jgi:hypothetical protein
MDGRTIGYLITMPRCGNIVWKRGTSGRLTAGHRSFLTGPSDFILNNIS